MKNRNATYTIIVCIILWLPLCIPLQAEGLFNEGNINIVENPFDSGLPSENFHQGLYGDNPMLRATGGGSGTPIDGGTGANEGDEGFNGAAVPIDSGFIIMGLFVLAYALFIHFRMKIQKKQEEEDRKKKRAIQSDDFNLMIK